LEVARASFAAHGGELDVARTASCLRPGAHVADGEAGEPAAVLDEDRVPEPVRLGGADLAGEVEAGEKRPGDIPLPLEPAWSLAFRERRKAPRRIRRRAGHRPAQQRSEKARIESELLIERVVLRAVREREKPAVN